MGEIRFVGTGKTRGYPYLVCKKYIVIISVDKISDLIQSNESHVTLKPTPATYTRTRMRANTCAHAQTRFVFIECIIQTGTSAKMYDITAAAKSVVFKKKMVIIMLHATHLRSKSIFCII